MNKLYGIAGGVLLLAVACDSGKDDVITPKAATVANAPDASTQMPTEPADATADREASALDAGATSPAACGTFSLGSSGYYTSGEFRGAAWTNVSPGTTISPVTFSDQDPSAPLCVQGTIVVSTQPNAWAILGVDLDAVKRDVVTDAGAVSSVEEANTWVPTSDGLIVSVSNAGNSPLRLCVNGTDSSLQWCAAYTGQTFVPWSSFLDNFGGGPNPYARQPIVSFDLTVPTPGNGQPMAFDFCLNSVVEAAGWCGCDAGPCTCPTGTSACGGSCVDLDTSPSHCGSCSTACASTSACGQGGCDDTIVAGQTDPFGVTVDSNNAYFTNVVGGTIVKVPLAGGNPIVLASGQASPLAVVVDGTNAYWVNNGTAANNYLDGTVETVALTGGTPVTLAAGQAGPLQIAVDPNNVYWTNAGSSANSYIDGTVMKLPLGDGGAPVVLASAQPNPIGIAVDPNNVYWTNAGTSTNNYTDGTVAKVPLTGGTAVRLASAQANPTGIAIDGSYAYFTNALDGTVVRVSLGGGTPLTLASSQSRPYGIAVDPTNVYWTNAFGGTVMKRALAGGNPVTLATGQNHPYGIAAFAGIAYVATQDGAGAGGLLRISP